MTTILLSTELVDPAPQADDITTLFDKPSHYIIESYGDPRSDKPRPFSTFKSIIFSGVRYSDKVAACSCVKMELLKFGDEAYTRCADHGVQLIGQLRREIGKKATK